MFLNQRYYNYLKNENKIIERDNKDQKDFDLILKAYKFKKGKKCAKQIMMVLDNEFNVYFNLKKIRRLMKKYGLKCPIRQANPYRRMMKATQEHTTCENTVIIVTHNALIAEIADRVIRLKNGKIESNEISRFEVVEGEKFSKDKKGIWIDKYHADKQNIKIGDTINRHIYGSKKYYNSKIVGFYRDPQVQGLTATKEYIESLDIEYKADTIYTNEDLKNTKNIEM